MNKQPDSPDPYDDQYDENVPDASELLDFELIAKSQPDKGHGLWLWVVLVLVLAGGGWAGWMYVQDQAADDQASAGNVPMILAPKFDLKEKPADPGGMNVPDRDKLVYDRMAGEQDSGGAGQVERLLPPPETPIEPPQAMPQALEPVADAAPAPAPEMTPEAAPTPPPAPPAAAPSAPQEVAKAQPAPEPAPAPPPKAAPEVKPAPAPAPEPEPSPAAAKATGTAGQGYMVQLSAVRNEADAKNEWARMVKKHSDVLGGLELVIQRADLGVKGVFYRVRGGWFANRNEAKAICDELAKRNVGCLIAKP
ncbi:SPOR domain-containing protein [Magnetovibrio sp.]|uniref:SPOR domain-containing protein n=1 Tax=Magnetovibrio sp. TaxID=2024836 RepID=UPI002F92D95A